MLISNKFIDFWEFICFSSMFFTFIEYFFEILQSKCTLRKIYGICYYEGETIFYCCPLREI